ncbi:uncharacterized protein L969DRAFT_97413 [Mixia osmundae IAM 14324]|uniref:PIG-U-domain-containing protein n=1 Tax=Mixia osmundae (strain CBS 9802 / IAM 14324 / JCM 22182 / KY 12970) TaxID=764103 RepID=G7DUK4_MIXOS|nr:uncharacterized protein L969DRAFT_97413 [Mixia osmundae IAM 14324]KEI36402.1 hypothetical protein L969DRAFT_97413 [Mixia osmundae IAM 14324]GAA94264.1 hypothetical protein E5Q_00913 [Mixia osmundae IAM 14324]
MPDDSLQAAGILLASAALRLSLFATSLPEKLALWPEISTPLTSFRHLREGAHLRQLGIDPYGGSSFHQAPALLALFSSEFLASRWSTAMAWTVVDLLSALIVCRLAQQRPTPTPLRVLAIASFHPFTIVSCLARTTAPLAHAITLASILASSSGHGYASMMLLALACHVSPVAILLLAPVSMLSLRQSPGSVRGVSLIHLSMFFVSTAALLAFSRLWLGSWSFMDSYIVFLTVSDLTPTIGLSWYFFIEMFDHFRSFFVATFQLHLLIYVAPVCIKLRRDPLYACATIIGIGSLFQSYPSVSDVALYHSLLPLYPEIMPHLRHPMLTACLLLYATALLKSFHHLWLYAGSGNANFYYASTLVWNLGLGLGLIDNVWAFLTHDFLTRHKLDKDTTVVSQR